MYRVVWTSDRLDVSKLDTTSHYGEYHKRSLPDVMKKHPRWGSQLTLINLMLLTFYALILSYPDGSNARIPGLFSTTPTRLPLTDWPEITSLVIHVIGWTIIGTAGLWMLGSTVREAKRWHQAGWILRNTSTSLAETVAGPAFLAWLNTLSGQWRSDAWLPSHFSGTPVQAQHELVLLVLHYRQNTRPPLWVASHARQLVSMCPADVFI